MTAHELMIKTNHHLIKGGVLSEAQKARIVGNLLSARSDERARLSFYTGVKYPNNVDDEGDVIGTYPRYYIPPYNAGKKLQTIIPMSPKTHIFAANSYELEIIRLLHLFAPEDPAVKDMVRGTLKRLKTACFANDCIIGECFHSTLPSLRFLAAVAPEEAAWINKLIAKFTGNIEDKHTSGKCPGNAYWYFWLCLSELPFDIAEPALAKDKDKLFTQLNKSASMNAESDKIHHPFLLCVLRNCLCRFPDYAYIKDRQPYLSEKDGRLHFDTAPTL